MEAEVQTLRNYPLYKLLRRNVTLEAPHLGDILTKARLKRLYFKKIEHHRFGNEAKYYLKGKQASCLHSLSVKTVIETRYFIMVKHAKVLKKFSLFEPFEIDSLKQIVVFVKRLSKGLEDIDLSMVTQKYKAQEIQDLYRSLSALKNLKVIDEIIDYNDEDSELHDEKFKIMDRYMPKLKNLVEFNNNQTRERYFCFVRALQQTLPCPYAAEQMLKFYPDWFEECGIVVYGDEDEVHSEGYIREDHRRKHDNQFDPEGEHVYKQIGLLFRFNLFPNLKKLNLSFDERFRYQLGPFAMKGFKSLHSLEQLTLDMGSRFYDYRPLFEGLCSTPLLLGLNIVFRFFKDDLNDLVTRFVQQQSQLVSLSFYAFTSEILTKGEYKRQNLFLENIWQCLNNKPRLEYIRISSVNWTLESLTKGLNNTEIINNLQSFDINVFDDCIGALLTPAKRVEGLCRFLKKHKSTLKTLECRLQFVSEDSIVDNLIKTISELQELKLFLLVLNSSSNAVDLSYKDFLRTIYNVQGSLKTKRLTFKKTFVHFERTLRNLQKLSELYVILYPFSSSELESSVDSSVVLRALVSMKALRRVYLGLPFLETTDEDYTTKMNILLQLENVTRIFVKDSLYGESDELQDIRYQIERKQLLRCDLMFYRTNHEADLWQLL